MTTVRRSKFGPPPLDRSEKPCAVCKAVKPLEDFGPDRHRADGRKRQCRVCCARTSREWAAANPASVRATKFKKKYGITVEEYEELYSRQDGKCAICGCDLPHHLDPANRDLRQRIAIDHDHQTGKVRGLLCGPCNCAIGYMEDNVERLLAAARYLGA